MSHDLRPKTTSAERSELLRSTGRNRDQDYELVQTRLFQLLFEELTGHIDAYIDTALDERLGVDRKVA